LNNLTPPLVELTKIKLKKMNKTKAIRHGDLALIEIDKLPEGLKQFKTKVIMRGSHGHDHSFDNGKLYLKQVDSFVFGYLVAKNTILFHPEHGFKNLGQGFEKNRTGKGNIGRPKLKNGFKKTGLREAKIADGIYELRKQIEDTHEGMKPVID